MTLRAPKLLLSVLALLVLMGLTALGIQMMQLRQARHATAAANAFESPDGRWVIRLNYATQGDPMRVLVRVFNSDGELRGEEFRQLAPGTADPHWHCEAGVCNAWSLALGKDNVPVGLPPGRLSRWRAAVP